uniref:DUF4878 domain-containing protein n=1 Tax=uncultured Thiotrichaceae bacterium TaxID=298394 RepID=A0A6S6UMG2_9GAMM|nr:MAG: Unknown protein [uncultured Thiotrichaceae bacterium]
MTAINRFKKWGLVVSLLFSLFLFGGCVSSEQQQAREVANDFWQAVLKQDMETAKSLVTWDSVEYLKFLSNKKVLAQSFETGELQITDGVAEIATVLNTGSSDEMQIPVRTVLIRHEDGWLVDVQKTLGSMVSGAMGSIVGQLNNFMQEGLKGLDESLSDSIDQLGKSLENGLQDLQKELAKPPVVVPRKDGKQAI